MNLVHNLDALCFALDIQPVRVMAEYGTFTTPVEVEDMLAFAAAVADGCEVPVPGIEGRRSLEIIRGAYLSQTRGAPVTFPVRES